MNDYGQKVEEFEFQFIDGEQIDCELAQAWVLNQANFSAYLKACHDWEYDSKVRFIAATECGFTPKGNASDPDTLDVEIFNIDSLRELAEQFVEDGLYGDIPDSLQYYIDYDAIARDLAMEYSETTIAGETIVFACR